MKIFYLKQLPLLLRRFYKYRVIIIYIFCNTACSPGAHHDEHPDAHTAIVKKFDTTFVKLPLNQSLVFIDSAFAAIANPGPGDLYVKDSLKQILYSWHAGDYIHAISYADSMLLLSRNRLGEEKYARRYAHALLDKASCLRHMKRYNEAFYYYSTAHEIVFEHVKNKCGLAEYSGGIAVLMFAQEKYLPGAAYFLKQYNELKTDCSPDDYRHLMSLEATLNNVALCYLRSGLTDSASWYEKAALETIAVAERKYPAYAVNSRYAKAVIYADQAEVLAMKGKFAEAASLYKESIAFTSLADKSYTQLTLARLAEVYMKDDKPLLVHETLDKLKASLDSMPNEKQLLKWHLLQAAYFTQQGKPDTASKLQLTYIMLRDSIELRDKKFVAMDIGKEFENLQLKYSNDVLQKEGALKSLYLVIAILIVILVTTVAVLVSYNLKQARKLNMAVQQKNGDLQKALFSLEQSHEENSRIIHIVAHDLINPIGAISNIVYSMQRKTAATEFSPMLQLINEACSSSMEIIGDVLNEGKNISGIKKELVDMKKLLEYCVDLLQPKADEKKQRLILQAETVVFMMNRQKIWRVVSNLVNNAIKFSPEHSFISIKLQRNGPAVLLSVRDNGIGIPAGLKDKLFSSLPEPGRVGTSGEKSYGLGLSISQKIIQEHSGKIWFESTGEAGSVFYVELPYLN